MDKIDSFKGKYYFLSNFYKATVTFDGITYTNNEAAFQAQKVLDHNTRLEFSKLNPSQAKYKGRRVELREDWEDVKCNLMYDICKAKFTQNLGLREMLLSTGDSYLEEGNNWGDKTWGTVNGVGSNLLGIILMEIRNVLQEGQQ